MTTRNWTNGAGGTDWFHVHHTDPGQQDDVATSQWDIPNAGVPGGGDSVVIGNNFTVTNAFPQAAQGMIALSGLSVGTGTIVTGFDLVMAGINGSGVIADAGRLNVDVIQVQTANLQLSGGGTISFSGSSEFNSNNSDITYEFYNGNGPVTITNGDKLQGSFNVTATAGGLTFNNQNLMDSNVNSGPLVHSTIIFGSFVTVNNSSLIEATGQGSSVQFTGSGSSTLDNMLTGTILASGLGSHVDIADGTVITNDGALVANGGTLNVMDSVVGTGSAMITGGGTMSFALGFQESLLFSGNNAGTLNLSQLDLGLISGFASGDTINLSYVKSTPVHAVWQSGSGLLAIEDSANNVVTALHLAGTYSTSEFILGRSGSGTSITFNPNAIPSSDFDGGGTSDVLWFDPTSGTVGDWLMSNGTPTWHGVGQASATVSVKGFGDFNGNGTSDILWENPTNGVVGDWLMSNNVPTWHQIGQGSTTMNIAGVGDFNGDGTADILWQNPTNNLVGEWQMSNNVPAWQLVGQGSTTMNIAGIGDFNGDGKSDILWENPTNNLVGMWGMNGSVPTWSLISQGSTTMQIVGVGDFTGNGTDDILWENPTNGTVGFWGMNSGQATSWNVVATASTGYQVAGISDYYGNGTDDILWRNATTGDVGVWAMNNGQATWHDLGISSTSFNTVKA